MRHVAAAAIGALALLVPIVVAAVVVAVASSLVSRPDGALRFAWWFAVFALSAAAAWGVDHLLRHRLPLVGLLRLSLVFPADVGSRLGLALRAASVRDLERGVIDLRVDAGLDPKEAAAKIVALAGSLQRHDRFTRGHCERVRAYTDLLAAELGVSKEDRELLRWAALLHDIGKLEVAPELLNKPGKLDEDEWHAMQEHAAAGIRLGEPLRVWLGDWVDAIGQHHERYDGSGYPLGLDGTEISLAARIVTVADCFETMTATRPYKKPMTQQAAKEELVAQTGKHFDPEVVRAMLGLSVRKLRWAAGPIAGIGDAVVVEALGHIGSVSALPGVGPALGSWASTVGTVSPLRVVGATAAVLAATTAGPALQNDSPTPVPTAPAVATAGPARSAPSSVANDDPIVRASGQSPAGAANALPPGHAKDNASPLDGARGGGKSDVGPNAVVDGTGDVGTASPGVTVPSGATPAVPGVSPAIPPPKDDKPDVTVPKEPKDDDLVERVVPDTTVPTIDLRDMGDLLP